VYPWSHAHCTSTATHTITLQLLCTDRDTVQPVEMLLEHLQAATITVTVMALRLPRTTKRKSRGPMRLMATALNLSRHCTFKNDMGNSSFVQHRIAPDVSCGQRSSFV
jgi:hypothetical protein